MGLLQSIFKIILIILIYCIICGIIVSVCYKQHIIDNWGEYQCQPYIMPIAAFFGKDTVKNFTGCLFSKSSSNFNIFMQPLFNITNLMSGVLGDFTGSLNSLRQMGNQIRSLFGGIGTSIMNRISDTASTLQFLFVKMTAMIQRLFGVFTVLIYTMITSTEMLNSVINGPIGSLMNTFCFDENTIIDILTGSKMIKQLELNDVLLHQNKIISIIKTSTNYPLYKYDNINITGGHLVFHNNKWCPIYKTNSKISFDSNDKIIYCLTTANNKINIGDNLFTDFIGTNNNFINSYIKQCFLNKLNHCISYDHNFINSNINKINDSANNNYYISGFSENTLIKKHLTNESVLISKIKINDIIEGNRKVIGLVKHKNLSIPFYKLNDLIVSGDQIIYYKNKWELVKNIPLSIPIVYNDVIYNLITEDNQIKINQFLFTDFQESNNQKLNEFIDNLVLDYLNNYKLSVN